MSTPRRRVPPRSQPRRTRWIWLVGGIGAAALIVFIAMTAQPESAPTAVDAGVTAEGKQLFLTSCAACHGVDLMGTETGPPFLHVYYAPNHHSDEAFQQAVAFGVIPHHWDFGPMDPVPGLTREDVAMIVAFVRYEQQAAGITRDPSHP